MPITINGSGTVTGISAGGLPDNCIVTADIAAGAVTQAKRSEELTLDTAKASTSGTFIDFTGIPSWVKRVTVMFGGVSTNGTSNFLIRLGTSGGFETTDYESSADLNAVAVTEPSGVLVRNLGAVNIHFGQVVFTLISGNVWAVAGVVRPNSAVAGGVLGSYKTLSATLDRIRITTVNGTDTFDAGTINILYE